MSVGDVLLAVVDRARVEGVDPEQELRDAVRRYAQQVRALEAEPGSRGRRGGGSVRAELCHESRQTSAAASAPTRPARPPRGRA